MKKAIALVLAIIVGSIVGVGAGIVVFIISTIVLFGYWAQGVGDANRSTQHIRDREIINELKKMNNKDE